jgi:uncharacterized membrane protein YdbT with pleckstrin-like domain
MRIRTPEVSYLVPRAVGVYLLPHEDPVITVRKHPAIFAAHASLLAGACAAAGLLTAITSSSPLVLAVAWGMCFLIFLHLVARVAAWRGTYVVATEARMIFIAGLVARKVVTVPVREIADVSLHRSWPGRVLGYGKLVAIPARSGYEIPRMNYMPYPSEVSLEIRRVLKLSGNGEDSQEPESEEPRGKRGTERTWLKPL